MDINSSQAPLAENDYTHTPPGPTVKKTQLIDFSYSKYKSKSNEVPVHSVAGSTLPLVQLPKYEEAGGYDPFEHRKVPHPTSDLDTLIHLLKGSLGSGILAMPLAFYNGGLWFGLFATFAVGAICTYCVHILVKCAHKLCHRAQIPSLSFPDVAETAFLAGPEFLHKYSRLAKFIVNAFLIIDLIGCCCVYNVFVAENLKQIIDFYLNTTIEVQYVLAGLLVPLILINLIRNLKYLTPFSMIANILISIGMGITMYYIFIDLPSVSERRAIAPVEHMPAFFGTVIFALEGIGVVMTLENNMKHPKHFIGCPSVLNIGMTIVIALYASVGFLGYLKFGDKTEGSVTLNLPVNEVLAQSVKLMIAIAIFLTYALQFYVPMEIIWRNIKGYFSEELKDKGEYGTRVILVIFTVAVAAAIPNLGPFISLIGALCLSTLGLMLPAIIEIVTYWESPGFGRYNWRVWKNLLLLVFGIIGFVTGTYVSILEIIEAHK